MSYSYLNETIVYNIINGDTESAIAYFRSFGAISALIFILLVIAEVVFAPVPPLILYVIAGALFGGFYGGVLVLVGNLIGAYIDFIIARYFLRERAKKRISNDLRLKFNKFFDKYGSVSIIILRINPLTTSDLVSYLAGLTNIKPIKFLLSTAIGLTPLIFTQTYLGHLLSTEYPFLNKIILIFSLIYVFIIIYLLFSPKKIKND